MSTEVAPGVDLVTKAFAAEEINLTPGERSMVAWITCDNVDLEGDVVVSSGVDFKHYLESNPVVLAIHDMGKWPVGQCQWIKLKKNGGFNGLVAKNDFDDDPDSEIIWRKVKRKTIRSVSVGFIPPEDLKPGEWGPPTREELLRRPDWAKARRIIRRCVLKEYSVCPIGMNQTALIFATSKGFHRPNHSTLEVSMSEIAEILPDPTEAETKAAKPSGGCDCGEKDCSCGDKPMQTKDDEDFDDEEKAVDDAEDLDEEEAEPEESGAFKRYDHVSVKSPHYKGVGRLESIHTCGHVPHAKNHLMGTRDDPAACVKAYRKMGDGHVATDDHVAVKLAHLTKMGTPLSPPSKKSAPKPTTKTVRTEPVVEPLPPLAIQSDQEVRAEAILKLNALLHPDNLRKMVREEAERAAGYV